MAAAIYLDNHATTRVDDRVLGAMLPYFTESYGNAASTSHAYGWAAEAAVELARERVAGLVGGQASEIVFTSGATEANNLALLGALSAAAKDENLGHVLSVATEHSSVLDPLAKLARGGAAVTLLPVASDGTLAIETTLGAIRDDTVLVSIMLANNEIGVVHPVGDIFAALRARRPSLILHCDAVQGASTLDLDVAALGADMVSLSAHKMYGPKGVGALWVRRRPRIALEPLLFGGGHERGLRSGTLPVPLVVGFGVAAEIAVAERGADRLRIAALRDELLARLAAGLPDLEVHGSLDCRLAGNLNISLPGLAGEPLIMAAREIAISSGSACSSAALGGSHVLRAIGVEGERADSALRFGIGRYNSAADIAAAAAAVIGAADRLRGGTPM